MILDFSIGNYRSFNKIQTLDFRATPLVSEDKTVDRNNIKESAGSGILKTIGLYGPNGSGKSNLVKGLRIFQLLVERSLDSEGIMDFAADP
ncbi:MAG TPA: AAA family ATPase, partial [Candidatus Babeliaceae bacterium]|nr:AAA family ATPase [Candidatus Babeliaceae bacterium]